MHTAAKTGMGHALVPLCDPAIPAHDREPWFLTYTGKQFFPRDPTPEQFDIRDIARALAYTCRFNGHVAQFYSVAQHSIKVAQCVPKALRLRALMHDAAEAYTGDLIRPIKVDAPWFRTLEDKVMSAICTRFNLDEHEDPRIKEADIRLLATERRDVLSEAGQKVWTDVAGYTPLRGRLGKWSPEISEKRFLFYFDKFGGVR